MSRYILALDQGTTSSRAMVFDLDGRPVATAQQEFPQILPGPGLVEHDPRAIWQSQLDTARGALAAARASAGDIAAIGIANQRETTVVWDRHSGEPVANAIVWQSRVSSAICERLKSQGLEPLFVERTGLVLDAYFSGTKLTWLLENRPELRGPALRGELAFGTVDTWLLWKLTGGEVHATDPSNASRTLMWNLRSGDWDDTLLTILGVPRAMLPQVRSSSEFYGESLAEHLGGRIPIAGMAGDQQAALFGHGGFRTGTIKNTYGTGCFALLNCGTSPPASKHQLLSTVGWQFRGQTTYCLEGSVFIAGAAVQWLRDGLKLADSSAAIARLADGLNDAGGVFFVPAFVGLGAPYWDPYARGTIVGIHRGTTAGHLARAAIEAMAYQTRDLLEAMRKDAGVDLPVLKVDGGAAVNDGLLQFQADILGLAVERPKVFETTALGAAYLAGLAVGYWRDLDEIAAHASVDRRFEPSMSAERRESLYARWRQAVERSRAWHQPG